MFTAYLNDSRHAATNRGPDVSAHALSAVLRRYTDAPLDTIERIGGVGGEVRIYSGTTFIGGIRKLGTGVHYYPTACQ